LLFTRSQKVLAHSRAVQRLRTVCKATLMAQTWSLPYPMWSGVALGAQRVHFRRKERKAKLALKRQL